MKTQVWWTAVPGARRGGQSRYQALRQVWWTVALGAALAACAPRPAARTTEGQTPYHVPLTSPGTQFSRTPPAVQNTIRAEASTADIFDIVKDTSSGREVYRVYFTNSKLYPPLYIAADGSVLNPDLTVAVPAPTDATGGLSGGSVTGVKPSELPPKVVKVMQERAPGSEPDRIDKEVWGDRSVYIISFKNPTQYRKLYIAADGTVLNEVPK